MNNQPKGEMMDEGKTYEKLSASGLGLIAPPPPVVNPGL